MEILYVYRECYETLVSICPVAVVLDFDFFFLWLLVDLYRYVQVVCVFPCDFGFCGSLISSYVGVQTGQAMATALNVVQTSHSYGDLMLLAKAAQLQQVCASLSIQ